MQKQERHAAQPVHPIDTRRIIRQVTGGGATEAVAEELLQECMLTVWHKAHTYKPESGAATTWLYTILRNKRIDAARQNHFEEVCSDDLFPEEAGEALENEVASDLEARAVRIMLQSLPEEQRQIVYKVYFEGKSHTEIAARKELPVHTHRGNEYTLVMAGSFSDASGDFILADTHVTHQPRAWEREDCICFAVMDAPLKMTGFFGRLLNPFLR
jgi:RNA polymerase sigma-70 factor, ECF subfamily